ncbi:josephin-1-like [Penaeus monodon]|uniref:josephin-1-like n=1 Tax=Penaeus monodon TaxID=6687 RepID=UPI0018A77005|nr:josephin-1-like [Penaeus monodon]
MTERCSSCISHCFLEIIGCEENQVGVVMTPDIYHEKQIKELCALHSLNNLFQDGGAFAKSELDNICYALSPDNWFNPHKSLLGTGNYDINVIMAALVTKGCGIEWFDKRKDPNMIVLEKVVGFILNVPSEYRLGPVQLPLRRKHWIAIRNIRGVYYNLDSKLEAPEIIGKEQELKNYLREELRNKDKELFVVVTQEVEQARSWCSPSTSDSSTNKIGAIESGAVGDSLYLGSCEGVQDTKAFNPPGFSFIDQDPLVGDTPASEVAIKANNHEKF